ncbi:hypothetical protein [Ruminococcus sp.]|nr:hypothetical protein [Ruminococcus sp.]MEE1261518.1 hypothetical protein [Ruminococcus sp.]
MIIISFSRYKKPAIKHQLPTTNYQLNYHQLIYYQLFYYQLNYTN